MQIYDCFTFYNELDLLELRLTELYDVVNHFVIVEANTTFTNRPKPFLFEENKERYSKFLDKIIHVRVDDMPGDADPWANEKFQRNAILRGLVDANDDDIVIVSDCDEVLRAAAVAHMSTKQQTLFALRMPLYNFKFNYMRTTPGEYDCWPMATRKSTFNDITPDTLRNMRFNFNGLPFQFVDNGCEVIEHAGWHFGYLGDREYLIDKAQSFSHQEVNRPDFIEQIDIEASMQAGKEWDRTQTSQYRVVELDSYFPKTVTQYPQFISDNPVTKALALLPEYPYNS
jgi:hypothetical protein